MTRRGKADLKGAYLEEANLPEEKLSGFNLENAKLSGAHTGFGNVACQHVEGGARDARKLELSVDDDLQR